MRSKSSGTVKVSYPRFRREELLRLLAERAKSLQANLPLERVVLFGSYAAGRQTAASDIDLLVIYGGEPRPDAYAVVRKTLDIPRLEPHVYAEAEYQAVKETVDRMIRSGVEIVGEAARQSRIQSPADS